MRKLVFGAFVGGFVLAACEAEVLPGEGESYVLVTAAGSRPPAPVDSLFFGGTNRFFRVLGGSLELTSADSATFTHATDIVERLPDGGLREWAAECTTLRVPYRREGSRLVVTSDPNAFAPAGSPPQPVEEDTFQVSGSSLVRHETVNGSSVRLVYSPGEPAASICG